MRVDKTSPDDKPAQKPTASAGRPARRRRRRFADDDKSNLEVRFDAQKLAFGPMMFQAARTVRDTGALDYINRQKADGVTPEELADNVPDLSLYAARVLLEAALAAEMVALKGDRFVITKLGYMVLMDPMTRVNMDFVHDVCYQAFFHFEEAIRTGKPAGLKELGDFPTVYEGLAKLPQRVRDSWFAFDHFYSDGVFDSVLPIVFGAKPSKVLDVGGNTGKWAAKCCEYDEEVNVTIVDLPGQLANAMDNLKAKGFSDRVQGHPTDLLSVDASLPADHEVIWMSQFLDCFSEVEIVSILSRAAEVMQPGTPLYILETYWDRQRFDAARFSVINTSLYFTAVANGNSKMYHSDRMKACVEKAGLTVEQEWDEIGISHTLFRCGLKK